MIVRRLDRSECWKYTRKKMNCVVSNVTCNAFSPSNSSGDTSNNNIFSLHSSNPLSPNVMVRFHQQLEVPVKNHHQNELPKLKRKRPAKINVPIVRSLENVVITPLDRLEEIEVEGDGYGVYSKRGTSRAHLEDRYATIVNDVHSLPKQVIYYCMHSLILFFKPQIEILRSFACFKAKVQFVINFTNMYMEIKTIISILLDLYF